MAVAIIAALFLFGRYELMRLDSANLARLDRWTGQVEFCSPRDPCHSPRPSDSANNLTVEILTDEDLIFDNTATDKPDR